MEAHRAHRRRQAQEQAIMLYNHAQLCRAAFEGKMPKLWEAFDLWSEEEIRQAETERLKQMLLNLKPGGNADESRTTE